MATIYIAGPMTGYPDHNYPAFDAAAAQLEQDGYTVLTPSRINDEQDFTPGTQTWETYMRYSLTMVLDADAVALLPGWQQSRGATLEHRVARELGLPVADLHEWTRQDAA